MHEVNEFLVLDFVRSRRETNRADIARGLTLSPASVSRIVRRLAALGLVNETPGESRRGRPRITVAFNRDAGCVAGIDLGGTKCHGVLADLTGEVVWQDIRPTDREGSPDQTLAAMVRALLHRADELGRPVAALAVGVPAIVDPDTGLALGGPNVHWDDFPIVERLAALADVPFVVENDVNLAALAHAWRGEGRGRPNFAILAIGTGIGASIVVDGRLVKGQRSAAGEVGYLVLRRDQLSRPVDGGLGAFERIAGGPAIASRAAERMTGRPSTEAVFAAAAAGDPVATDLLREIVDYIAMAIIGIAVTVAPEVVILEGSVGCAFATFLDELRAHLAAHLPLPPALVVSTLGGDATALGAVAAALRLARNQQAPSALVSSLDVA